MNYNWKYKDDMSNNYYHDECGKIVGEITRVNFSDDIWHANVGDNKLGQYINNRSARKAVEDFINNPVVNYSYENGYSSSEGISEDYMPFLDAQDINFYMDIDLDDSVLVDLSDIEDTKPKKKKK